MSENETTTQPRTVFRRATAQDALDLARTAFLADERVDMQTLAAELGIARATLHRWVQTRENLLDRVLGDLAREFFELSRAPAHGRPDDVIADVIRVIVTNTATFQPIRGFVQREPELALRLLVGERSSVRRGLLEELQQLIADVLPDEAEQLRGYAEAMVPVGLALAWPTLVAGDEPSGERIATVSRALLCAARAGQLPPGAF
ncbi:MAG TPA: QsdR family transcriptional regulator [Solirubrobacteraceae bacterium]|nr:QsdR family transcriptional regulator [Solirubrobacteraceae bacterium]